MRLAKILAGVGLAACLATSLAPVAAEASSPYTRMDKMRHNGMMRHHGMMQHHRMMHYHHRMMRRHNRM